MQNTLLFRLNGVGPTGSLSFLIEDSWPKSFVCLGWRNIPEGLEVLVKHCLHHLQFEELLEEEQGAVQVIKVGVLM